MNNLPEIFGANPANPKWRIVRGDTQKIRIEFLEPDEVTYWNTNDWTFSSSTYNYQGQLVDELEVVVGVGYVDIVASSEITASWGVGQKPISASLSFDLQVTIDGEIWTPVLGTIMVLSDVTRNGL